MPWPTKRAHDDNIEPKVALGKTSVALQEQKGGAFDALPLPWRHRLQGQAAGVPPLDLDDGEGPTPTGDKIDLAERRAPAPRQDAIALEAQKPGRRRLGP